MKRALCSLVAALMLMMTVAPTTASRPDYLNSVRPLQALSPVYAMTMFGLVETSDRSVRNICTTTSINRMDHLWLTAAHCVSDLKKRELRGNPLFVENQPANVVAIDYDWDLAIVKVPLLDVTAVKIAKYGPTWLDPAIVAGYPYGYPAMFVMKGRVANPAANLGVDGEYLIIDMPIAGGNSGSPIFNLKGEMVSVLQIGWGDGFSPGGGVPYVHLSQFALKYFWK